MRLNLDPPRAIVETLMVDTCKIRVGPDRLGEGAWDDLLGVYHEVPEEVLYVGPCMVSQTNLLGSQERYGTQETRTTDYTVKIPWDADLQNDVMPEDEIIITSIHEDGDIDMEGMVLIVNDTKRGTYMVWNKFRCMRLTRIPE